MELVLPQEPGRIEYNICLCGYFWSVSEIQNSLDASDLFKGHEELSSCSALSFPISIISMETSQLSSQAAVK